MMMASKFSGTEFHHSDVNFNASAVGHCRDDREISVPLLPNFEAGTDLDGYILVDWQLASLRAPSCFRAFIITAPQSKVAIIGRLSAISPKANFAPEQRSLYNQTEWTSTTKSSACAGSGRNPRWRRSSRS